MARTIQVTFDCARPGALADFWAIALGYEKPGPPGDHDTWEGFLAAQGVPEDRWDMASALEDPDGGGPRIFFQRVPEPKQVKNRLHLDLRAAVGLEGDQRMAALEVEADRLVAAGATRVERHEAGPLGAGHIVMLDPEGNEFCLD